MEQATKVAILNCSCVCLHLVVFDLHTRLVLGPGLAWCWNPGSRVLGSVSWVPGVSPPVNQCQLCGQSGFWGGTLLTRPSGLLSGLRARVKCCCSSSCSVLFRMCVCVACLLNKCGGIYANPCDALQNPHSHPHAVEEDDHLGICLMRP